MHTPSRQQLSEVAQLIRSTNPDVVLVELDQPRLEQLLKQQQRAGPLAGPPTLGAELAEAVAVAAACDTPVILGDAVLPLDALWRDRPLVDAPRLWRAARLRLRQRFPEVEVRRVSVARTFAADPQKAAPLLLSVGLTTALLGLTATATPASADAAAAAATSLSGAPSPSDMAASLLLVLLPLAALLRFVDVLLLARDDTLSENALRALEIGGRLRSGDLLRRRFRFSTRPQTLAALSLQLLRDEPLRDELLLGTGGAGGGTGGTLPFLTLRSPLLHGEVRRINLFEPRWLAMFDLVRRLNSAPRAPAPEGDGWPEPLEGDGWPEPLEGDGDRSAVDGRRSGGGGGGGGGGGAASLVNARLGTMHVVNRFYRPVEWAQAGEEAGAVGQRTATSELCSVEAVEADLVVNFREARRARVLRAEEGTRPGSGARRLAVWLVGEDALEVAPASVRAAEGGFLLGAMCGEAGGGGEAGRSDAEGGWTPPAAAACMDGGGLNQEVSVVCVVGLAHANSIVEQCAERGLLSAAERGGVDTEVARAVRERQAASGIAELGWEDYDRERERLP